MDIMTGYSLLRHLQPVSMLVRTFLVIRSSKKSNHEGETFLHTVRDYGKHAVTWTPHIGGAKHFDLSDLPLLLDFVRDRPGVTVVLVRGNRRVSLCERNPLDGQWA
jgi:hypothetical protein